MIGQSNTSFNDMSYSPQVLRENITDASPNDRNILNGKQGKWNKMQIQSFTTPCKGELHKDAISGQNRFKLENIENIENIELRL